MSQVLLAARPADLEQPPDDRRVPGVAGRTSALSKIAASPARRRRICWCSRWSSGTCSSTPDRAATCSATGGNPEAARLAGVPTDRDDLGLAHRLRRDRRDRRRRVLDAERASSLQHRPGYLFPAVAAVFLGASQLSQRPNVWGTLIAYFALAFGIQGLALTLRSARGLEPAVVPGRRPDRRRRMASRPVVAKVARPRRPAAEPGADASTPGEPADASERD